MMSDDDGRLDFLVSGLGDRITRLEAQIRRIRDVAASIDVLGQPDRWARLAAVLDDAVDYTVPLPPDDATTFQQALEDLLNRYSQENGSNTPDFLLATYLMGCLVNWNACVMERERWYGREPTPALRVKPEE